VGWQRVREEGAAAALTPREPLELPRREELLERALLVVEHEEQRVHCEGECIRR